MNSGHPSEMELQQWALDKSGAGIQDISKTGIQLKKHTDSCEQCQASLAMYRLMFTEIKQQPKPVFDFDLSALVLPQLSGTRPQPAAERFVAGFLIAFVCCSFAVPIFLFRQYILNMFTGIPPLFIYSILLSALIIVGCKTLDMYRKYQKQMQVLNFN